MAIRIEDTAHINSWMDGVPFVVGVVPHMFRKKLMAKHCDDYETGLQHVTFPSLVTKVLRYYRFFGSDM